MVRVIPDIPQPQDDEPNEEYYKIQCKLHIPWRDNFADILPEDTSWQDLYIKNLPLIDNADLFGAEIPAPDELEFENDDDSEDDIVRDAGMAAARLRPGSQQQDRLGNRPIDEAFNWENPNEDRIDEAEINQFLQTYQRPPIVGNADDNVIAYAALNPSQREVLDVLRNQILDPNYHTKCVIVQGKAGTGKSVVIRSMCRLIEGTYRGHAGIHQVLAPTGAAAVNIDGKTIHSFFRIPVYGALAPLNGTNLSNFQLQLRDTKYIIIDEYSMVGMRLLNKIHVRLCEGKSNSNEPFGGCCVYLFGDLRQLPPVNDIPIYSEPTDDFSRFGVRLVNSFTKKIVLSVQHRQGPDQQHFKQVLDGLATGTVTREGWNLLMSRKESILHEQLGLFETAIHLFSNNSQVQDYNERMTSQNGFAVARIDAINNNSTARQASDVLAGGLSRKLYLSIDSRIILRQNLCVARGLVNGSMGTVQYKHSVHWTHCLCVCVCWPVRGQEQSMSLFSKQWQQRKH